MSFCFSKGLGAPVGSILAGTAETIDRAHRYRKMLGGGMRQAGVLAAAALYSLDHHIDRIAEDHRRAKEFRAALKDAPSISFPLPSATNIVYVEVPDAMEFVGLIAEQGVLALPTAQRRLRCVFHLDVDDNGLDRAIEAFRRAAHVTHSHAG
jgi:threonine aldolase